MTVYELIEKHEGRRKRKYRCPAGAWTIGVGWNMDANPLPEDIAAYLKQHGEITEKMIDRLLVISVKRATEDCHYLFPDFDNFTENRRMALVDFVFQLGLTRAKRFVHSIAAMNTGRWEEAAARMRESLWFRQVPKRAATITKMIEED
jgi:lysozyme